MDTLADEDRVTTGHVKATPGRTGDGTVRRARLDDMLGDALKHDITLIQAPAGMGKSTLLRGWRQLIRARGIPLATVDVDEHLQNIVQFFSRALEQADPGLGTSIREHLHNATSQGAQFPTTEREITSVETALQGYGKDICVIFDDLHFLAEAEETTLRRLLARLPKNVTCIIASRSRPKLPLARLAAAGALLEIDQQALRFTRAETEQLLAETLDAGITPDEVESLFERTEGWAAGLRLAILSMTGQPDRARLIASFSGSKRVVSDFFSDDVVARQPVEMQTFLHEISVLERFTTDLCDAVTGRSDSDAFIKRIEDAGLFLVPLDDEARWFRFHSLFSGFLRRRAAALSPKRATDSQRRAAVWFTEQGMSNEALYHAERCDDPDFLAALLDQSCLELTYEGKLEFICALSERIPQDILARHPNILMTLAWRNIRRKRLDQARAQLDQAERLFGDATGPDRDADLRMLEHRRIMLAAADDDFAEVTTRATRLLEHQDRLHPYLVCNLYGQTIRAERDRFRFDQFERFEALGRRTLNESRNKFAFVAQQAIVGRTYLMQARTSAARRSLEFGLEQAIDFTSEGSTLAALPTMPLARLTYETDDVAGAERLVLGVIGNAQLYCLSDELLDGYGLIPRLRSLAGDFDGAADAIDTAQSLAAEVGAPRLIEGIRLEHVKLLLNHFHIDRALQLDPSQVTATHTFAPKTNATVVDSDVAETRVRLELARGNYPEALEVAQKWRTFCRQRGATRHFMGWTLLFAQLAAVEGDRRLAQRALREVLIPGSEAGFYRMFLDEGSRIFDLLQEGYLGQPETAHAVDRFAVDLLGRFRALGHRKTIEAEETYEDDPAVDRKLTVRELEILTLVASGLRNREIGDRLGLTEGSVKWYMQQIYDKVGTRRRSLAVERARQFGMLS